MNFRGRTLGDLIQDLPIGPVDPRAIRTLPTRAGVAGNPAYWGPRTGVGKPKLENSTRPSILLALVTLAKML